MKNLLAFLLLAFLAMPALALAQPDLGIEAVGSHIDLGEQDPRTTVALLINAAMLFLGVIAVGIVLLGGFKWMTAGGNEDKVGEARKLMGAGVVGLVIVLSAWGIATFILNQLLDATT